MKIYTCPKCGNVITNSESLYACPKCGCSADNFIVTDREETTSNNYNVSDSEQYKKESGIDQPVLSAKDYDVICPDCNSVIANENSDCSICGCPSNLFIKRAKTKFVYGEKLECPDCGKIFDEEPIPSSCPNCGCPSDKFKQHIEENTHQNSSTQNKNAFSAIFITLFIVGILGGFGYLAYSKVQEAAEQARQEQYAKERTQQENERRAKEEETRKEQERKDKQRRHKLCVNKWNYRHGSYYGENILESVGFSEDGSAWCSMTYYAGGNRIRTSSFDFYYSIKGDYIYVNGEKAYYFNGNVFEDMQGRRFTEVSRISF